jgi:transcriptional regulator with XRE-family HTH domain
VIRIRKPEAAGIAVAFMRNIAGLTQRQLAARTGFNQAQIAAWEAGHGRPNVASLLRVADVLGYDLALVPREDT